jgi:uncharacterized protein
VQALVTGATGLIGRRLVEHLPSTVVLTRDPARAQAALPQVRAYAWSPAGGAPPAEALRGIDVVFNLAGEPVGEGRWTTEKKRRIRDSRVLGTRHLVAGLASNRERPRVLVSASAVGYYGDRGDEDLDEASAAGRGFLAEVCQEWEHEAQAAEALGIRVVRARMGVVLAADGGALARMLPLFRAFVGGRLGSGQQWLPWIHIDDAVGILLHAAREEAMRGALNVVGPAPVRNAELAQALGHALGRPALLPVPGLALRMALGEMSEILTASQRAWPRVALRTGYAFRRASLAEALAAELRPATSHPAGSSS